MASVMSRKIEYSILILILIICAVYTSKVTMDYTITTRNLVWIIGTFILFLMVTVRAISEPKEVDLSILSRMIFPIICGFFVATLFSLIQAVNKGEGLYVALRTFGMIAFLVVATVIIRENNPNIIIKCIILLALGLVLYGMYQYFTITVNPAKRIGTMANMNLCSSGHLLLLPFSIYAVFKYSKIWKVIGICSVLLALFIIFFSLRTRSTWVAFFFMVIVATIHKRKLLALTLVSFVVLGIVLYTVKGERIFNTASMKQRNDLWSQSLNMLKDNPMGVGAGNWRIVIPFYARNMSKTTRDVAFRTIYFQRPHNDWMWVLTEMGFIGFILYAALFGLGLYYAIKSRNVLIYSGLVAYMVFAVFSFPKERSFHSIMMLLFMAFAISKYHTPKPIKLNRKVLYLGSVFILAGLSFAIVDFNYRYVTERNVLKLTKARLSKDWDTVLLKTENISNFSTLDSACTPLVYYKGVSNFIQKDFKRALRDSQKAVEQSPYHLGNLMLLSNCFIVHQRFREAQECYMSILELYPGHEGAQANLEALKNIKIVTKGN